MKISLPFGKSNKAESDMAPSTVFDLTGGSDDAVLAATKVSREPADDTFGLLHDAQSEFEVNVRNDEPILRMLSSDKISAVSWSCIRSNLAAAALVMAMLSLFMTAAAAPELIFYTIPGLILFLLLTVFELFEKEKIRLAAGAVIMLALVAALIIFRSYIVSGVALIVNQFYDEAEYAQAYLYDRFGVGAMGDEHPFRSMHYAAIWLSALIFLVAALPPASAKRIEVPVLAGLTMIMFAYYGMIPSWVCIAVMACALIFALSRGSLLSTLPLLIGVMLIFGVVIMADPGENYGISRADENFRDKFALKSAYIESNEASPEDLSGLEQEIQDQQQREREHTGSQYENDSNILAVVGVIGLILAVIAAAILFVLRKLRKRQAANRAGIDSDDPKEAITAMFPYIVKWLQPAGIESAGKAFASLIPMLRMDVSDEYGSRFADMYDIWEEAAYSDHEMTDNHRIVMEEFLDDTVNMVKENCDFRTRVINTFKYAL